MVRINNEKQEFSKKYFTIIEAEKLLPKIQKIMIRTIKLNKALELLGSIEFEVYDDDYDNYERRRTSTLRSCLAASSNFNAFATPRPLLPLR